MKQFITLCIITILTSCSNEAAQNSTKHQSNRPYTSINRNKYSNNSKMNESRKLKILKQEMEFYQSVYLGQITNFHDMSQIEAYNLYLQKKAEYDKLVNSKKAIHENPDILQEQTS